MAGHLCLSCPVEAFALDNCGSTALALSNPTCPCSKTLHRSNKTIWQCQDLSALVPMLERDCIEWIGRRSKPVFAPDRASRSELGGAAFVAMMQSSDLGGRDLASSRSVYWPGVRTMLVEREMRPGLVI
jgi:hypothetical protein